MIPVELEIMNITDDSKQEVASALLPAYVFKEPEVIVFGAHAEDGSLVGAMAFAPVKPKHAGSKKKKTPDDAYFDMITERLAGYTSKDMLRVHWIEVLPDYRREGIGIVLMDALTTVLAQSADMPKLTVWYDDEDAAYGLGDFLYDLRLFEISDDTFGDKPVHIALWTGETYGGQDA
ncbi:MAG: GNAT family N-acetyltransferase [Lachnospiraceae bacterium]|nr:GNAT family N-acetyltransferase [Lachnospiraceae bacterium]